MTNSTMRKPLSYILMFVVFNTLSNGQASNSVGDTLSRGTTPASSSVAEAHTGSLSNSPSVICNGDQLKISADNSTLASVLSDIQKCTGARIEVPDGAATNRVFSKLGPGPTREVLASLLTSNGFDYVIGSSQSDPDRVETVLLMPHLGDATAGSLPENTLTATSGDGKQTQADERPAAQPAQVALSAAPAVTNATTIKAPAAELAELITASADRFAVSNQLSVPVNVSEVAHVSSNSTSPNASRKAARSMESTAQARILSSGESSPTRWRDELTRFGISTDTYDGRLTNVAADANVRSAHEELSWYPVNLRSRQDLPSEADTSGPILLPAVDRHQVPSEGMATIGDESRKLSANLRTDPVATHYGNYIAAATRELGNRTDSHAENPISWEEPGEAIWQADRRLGLIVPVALILLIMLCQVTVGSLVKNKILLLAVPLFAIGAIWSLCFRHSNLAAAIWVGAIGLLSIQAEAGVFRLLHLELGNERTKSRGDLRNACQSAQDRPEMSHQKDWI